MQTTIINSIQFLKDWALQNHEVPKGTSLHAACLLHRGKILIHHKTGKIIATINSKEMCAERMLLRLCKRYCVKQD